MSKRTLSVGALAAATALWCSLSLTAQTPQTFNTATGQRIQVTQVAGGLVHPYSLAFPDARTILVSEQAGRLRIIRDGVLQPKPAWVIPPPAAGATVPARGADFL